MTPVYPDSITVYATLDGVKTNINQYVKGNIVCEGYGILSDDETDRTAGIGFAHFNLDNTGFKFNPQGSAPLSGFKRGTKIEIEVEFQGYTKNVFVGRVFRIPQSVLPAPLETIEVLLVDWMESAGLFPLNEIELQTNYRIEEAVIEILALMALQPESTSYSTGAFTFERVFDNISLNTKAISEFDKLAMSEFGFIYLRGDGQLVVESREDRNGFIDPTPIPSPLSENGFLELAGGGLFELAGGGNLILNSSQTPELTGIIDGNSLHGDDIINQINHRAFRKELDTSSYVNLIEKEQPTWALYLPSGKTTYVNYRYTDPNDRSQYVNGLDLQDPVASTDYEAFSNPDGTGTEYTNDITLTAIYYPWRARYQIYNPGPNCFLTLLQARGNPIYDYVPDENTLLDDVSIAEYGTFEIVLDQKYQLTLSAGDREAERIINLRKEPRAKMKQAHFIANVSAAFMMLFLRASIGDLIHLSNDEAGIDLYHHIQNERWTITPGGVIDFTYGLKEHHSFKKGYTTIAPHFSGFSGANNAIEFLSSPFIEDLSEMTASIWVYPVDGIAAFHPISKAYLNSSGDIVAGWYMFIDNDGYVYLHVAFDGGEGQWKSVDPAFDGLEDAWRFIAFTYDFNAANNPSIWVQDYGGELDLTEIDTPSGDYISDRDVSLTIGSVPAFGGFGTDAHVIFKDARIYDVDLFNSLEDLGDNEDDYDYLTDNLQFQAFAVHTISLDDYIGKSIEENMKLIENVHGFVGTAYHASGDDNYQMIGENIDYP